MKKRVFTVIAAVLVALICTGCEKKKTGHELNGVIFTNLRGMITEAAAITAENELVHYYDYTTGLDTILCSDVSCMHEPYSKSNNPNPVCMAALPYADYYMAVYGGNTYYITTSFEDVGTTDIWVEKTGEGGRRLLVSLPYTLRSLGGGGAPVTDGVLYIKLHEIVLNEVTKVPEYPIVLVAVDLNSGTYDVPLQSKTYEKQKIAYMEASGKYVYYLLDYYNEEKEHSSRILFRYDTETKESHIAMNEDEYAKYSFCGVRDDKVFVMERGGSVVYEYDESDSSLKEVISTESPLAKCVSICGYLLYYTEEGKAQRVWNYYKLATGDAGTFTRPDSEAYFMYANGTENTILIDLIDENSRGTGFVVIGIEDYIAGSTDYLLHHVE